MKDSSGAALSCVLLDLSSSGFHIKPFFIDYLTFTVFLFSEISSLRQWCPTPCTLGKRELLQFGHRMFLKGQCAKVLDPNFDTIGRYTKRWGHMWRLQMTEDVSLKGMMIFKTLPVSSCHQVSVYIATIFCPDVLSFRPESKTPTMCGVELLKCENQVNLSFL